MRVLSCKATCHAPITKNLTRAVVSPTPCAYRLDTGADATGPLYEAGQCSSNMRQLQNNDGRSGCHHNGRTAYSRTAYDTDKSVAECSISLCIALVPGQGRLGGARCEIGRANRVVRRHDACNCRMWLRQWGHAAESSVKVQFHPTFVPAAADFAGLCRRQDCQE